MNLNEIDGCHEIKSTSSPTMTPSKQTIYTHYIYDDGSTHHETINFT